VDPSLVIVATLVVGLVVFALVAPAHPGPRRRQQLGTLQARLEGADRLER
jgi:hypothetical protein